LRKRVTSDLVYTNSFTFNAVPSSIVNAGMTPVLVECTEGLIIDIVDLRKKFESRGGKILLLSYMRGMIPDVEKVKALCDEFGVLLVEDAAHAYGIDYKNRRIGSFGVASAMSTQSNKLINTGDSLLSTYDREISEKSIEVFQNKGVEVMSGFRVVEITPDEVKMKRSSDGAVRK